MKKLFNTLKRFSKEKDGAATLEVVILSAILVALALIFNDKIREFAKLIFDKMFNQSVIDRITLYLFY